MSLLKLTEDVFSMHTNRDNLEHEAVDVDTRIGKQADTNASWRRTKDESEHKVFKMRLLIQTQTEMIASLQLVTRTAALSLAALEESEIVRDTLASDWDALPEAIPLVKAMLHKTKEKLDGADE